MQLHHKVFYASTKWKRGVCSSSSRCPYLCSRRYFHCPVSRSRPGQSCAKKEFDQYSQCRVYECSPEYGSKSDTDHTELVVKIDSVYKELQKFQYRLSRALHVSPLALRLCQVEERCLLLLFLVPSFVELEIFSLLYNWLAGWILVNILVFTACVTSKVLKGKD